MSNNANCATEKTGVVVKLKRKIAQVEIKKSSACNGCKACVFGNDKKLILTVDNELKAKKGDEVTLSLPPEKPIAAFLTLYALPLIFVLLGLFVTSRFVSNELIVALGGAVGLAVGFLCIFLPEKLYFSKKYLAKIIKINTFKEKTKMIDLKLVAQTDPEVAQSMKRELTRQQSNIELIASENFVSPAVMAAVGSHLTNKYAEGYSGKRYYGGCMYVDEVETLAIERAKQLFGCEHANVQPHSGANANLATFFALLNVGDTVLSMSLAHGGHLSHGSPVNISGKEYNIVPYGVSDETEMIDYDEMERLALECKPRLILAGASAYPRTIDFKRIREIADKVGAYFMVDIAHIAGLVVAGLHPSPVPYADVVTTTTHKTLRGPRGGMIMCKEALAKQIDKAVFPGTQGGPLMHVIAGKAVAFKEALSPEFKAYQKQVILNAKALAESLTENGISLVSGGTDNHLMLVKVNDYDTTGKEIEKLLDECNITANKNTIPNDPQSPFITSGIRLGTPAATTRGFKEEDMKVIGALVAKIIKEKDAAVPFVKAEVAKLCAKYPLYDGLDNL